MQPNSDKVKLALKVMKMSWSRIVSKTELCIPSVITPLSVTNIIVIKQVRTKGCVLLQSTHHLAIHGHGKKFEVQFKLFKKSIEDKITIL